MQRTFVAITLALTLSCAFGATFTFQNYVKAPIAVIQDNETNYTNATNGNPLVLTSVNAGELDIVASTYVANNATPLNLSAGAWTAVYRKLDGKALSGTANTTLNFTAPSPLSGVGFSNGYVLTITNENDAGTNNIPQIVVYQTPVNGGAALARITLSSNTVNTYVPSRLATQAIGKNVYVFYLANNGNVTNPSQVNVTSFTVGSATKGSLEFNLTTTYAKNLNVVWGEALGTNQVYANWVEGASNTTWTLRYTTVDVTKGTYNATATAAAYVNTTTCHAFSTDKKWYGDLCHVSATANDTTTINYYIRYTNSTFLPFNSNGTLYLNSSNFYQVQPYGPYIAVIYQDSTAAPVTTYSYELWNLDTLVVNKAKTVFLTTDVSTEIFRVVSGGLYTLTYITNPVPNATLNHYQTIQVGLVLGSSYLTSVLGFIMTIVAGVLLF